MKKIIVAEKSFPVLKSTWGEIPKDRWQNYTVLKLRIRATTETKSFLYNQMDLNKDRFNNGYFTFHALKKDGIFLFETDLKGIQGLSKFPDGTEILQLSLVLWQQKPVPKREALQMQRDLILTDMGI